MRHLSSSIGNIDEVFGKGLCTQCGTCYSVCPRSNISIRRSKYRDYIFYVSDPKLCGRCSLCLQVCPGIEVDFDKIGGGLCGASRFSRLIGGFKRTCLTQALDATDRNRGSSGGTASTLLAYALEKRLIEGALVVKMQSQNPLEPQVFIAKTREHVFSAAQSKYIPVPMNIGLADILNGNGRYAMVGTPCHVQGLRKMVNLIPNLKRKMVFSLGLFCGPGPGFLLIDHLLSRLGIKREDVVSFKFREKSVDGKWPGGVQVVIGSGEEKYIPLRNILYAQTLFTRKRCDICPDFASEFADISLGDAHLPEFWRGEPFRASQSMILHGQTGWNSTIVRTDIGEELILGTSREGILKVVDIDVTRTEEAQKSGLYYKKRSIFARMAVARLIGRKLPRYIGFSRGNRLTLSEYVKPVISTVSWYLIQFRLIRLISVRIPISFLTRKFCYRKKLINKFFAS